MANRTLDRMPAPLDSRQLRAFVTLARTGSFTRTGRELHLSQSAVSHSLKALEEDLKCRLFERTGRSVRLTSAGEELLVHAERIVAEMATARERLGQLNRWGHGRIQVGVTTTACQYILPAVLREFKESFPHCAVQIEPGDTAALLDYLREGRIDFALGLEPPDKGAAEFRPLFVDELVGVVGPLHPWAATGQLDRATLAEQRFILYSKKSYVIALIEDYFRAEKLSLPVSMELGSVEAIKELVKLGLGVGILAPWALRKELAEGSLIAVSLGKRRLRRQWGILLRKGQRLGLAHETFIGICKTVTENFGT
ncbi:MAG TPA: LysR family transcriptional regulator [Candidatus Methylacidiphilales bacterium]